MPNSYVSNHVHIVFSTKSRLTVIPEAMQPKLWAYMAGIGKNYGMHAVAIGGIGDHAHSLIDMGPTVGIAKAVQVAKANSSRWMSEHSRVRFEWQEGYFACTTSWLKGIYTPREKPIKGRPFVFPGRLDNEAKVLP